jgi:hypothetical protein
VECTTVLPEHLTDLWTRSSKHLDKEQSDALASLLTKYQDAFSRTDDDIGRTERVTHMINTGNAIPIRQRSRCMPIGKQELEKGEVKRMLNQGIIEPSRSPWGSNIVLVIKKDGRPRFCVDNRMQNDVTKKDAYPLPRVDECMDALAGAKWFGSMDLNAGFWQIGMAPEDKEKTAFLTSFDLYQFTVMPFGLVNSPSSFERLMVNFKLASLRRINIRSSLHNHSSKVEQTDIISSKYRSSSFHWRPRRTSSISRSKLEGELTRPNGMTVNWYK